MRSKSCRVGFEGLNLRCAEVGALAPEPRPKGGVESEEAGGGGWSGRGQKRLDRG